MEAFCNPAVTSIITVTLFTASLNANYPKDRLFGSQIDFIPQKVAESQGHDVHAIGDLDIYSVSPDFFPETILQEGNNNPIIKIVPKKLYQILSFQIRFE